MCENGKMYMKNSSTYFNLNKWIFCTTVYSSFVPLIKGNVPQLFLELDLTIIFHWWARLEIIRTNNNWIIYWAQILKEQLGDLRDSNVNAVSALK